MRTLKGQKMLTVMIVAFIVIKMVLSFQRILQRKSLDKLMQYSKEKLENFEKGAGTREEIPEEIQKIRMRVASAGCLSLAIAPFIGMVIGLSVAQSMSGFFPKETTKIGSARLAPFGDVGTNNKQHFLGVGKIATTKFYFYIPETSETDVYKPAVTLFGERVTIYEEDRKSGRVVIYAQRSPPLSYLFTLPEPVRPEEEKQYEFQIPKGSQKELFTIE